MVSYDFTDKVAVVTGGASGIGQRIAERFIGAGASVLIADLNSARAMELANRLETGRAQAQVVDVTSALSVNAMVEAAEAAFGRLDYLINCAGVAGDAVPVAECPVENWDRVIAVNLTGIFLSMKYAIPLILRQGGAIVNFSSVAGLVAVPNQIPYIASKFGVIGATKSAAMDYAGQGIRVNAICPGGIRTPMLEEWLVADPTRERFMASGHPIGRIGTTDEIAGAALWLCSDAASFVTGIAMPIDGGLTVP